MRRGRRRSSASCGTLTVRAVFDASALLRAGILRDAEAQQWLEAVESRRVDALAPDLIWAEVGQTLRKYVRAGKLTSRTANEITVRLLGLPIVDEPLRPLAPLAAQIAAERHLSVYDSFYLVLAEAAEATLVTADRRLAAHAQHVALLT